MATMTTTVRRFRSTAPLAIALAGVVAAGIIIGFWATGSGSEPEQQSAVLGAEAHPSAGLTAYEAAKFAQISRADAALVAPASEVSAPASVLERKLAQMAAEDAMLAPETTRARDDVVRLKLAQMDRQDSSIPSQVERPSRIGIKLRQMDAQDAR